MRILQTLDCLYELEDPEATLAVDALVRHESNGLPCDVVVSWPEDSNGNPVRNGAPSISLEPAYASIDGKV